MASTALSLTEPFVNRSRRCSARSVAEDFMSTALQGGANDLQESVSQVSRHSLVSFDANNMSKDASVSYAAIDRTFAKRVSQAVSRRLFPHTSLTRQQLAHALGISVGTMDNLLNGNNTPSGRVIDALVAFFRESFVNDVWGCHNIHCFDSRLARKADAMRRLHEAQEELRRLG